MGWSHASAETCKRAPLFREPFVGPKKPTLILGGQPGEGAALIDSPVVVMFALWPRTRDERPPRNLPRPTCEVIKSPRSP